jgi:hypothetical protein
VAEPKYTSEYYDRFQRRARSSAGLVVPIVLDILEPGSVCDVGCGRGTWLSVFRQHGITDLCGIDGEHVRRDELEIHTDQFVAADLRHGVNLDRRFELVVCLEVAEHLPAGSAGTLIDGLTGLAPAVLFSAAIPQQGGTGHVNEQWPEYWEAHFRRNDHLAVDCIRPKIWNEQQVAFWYAQNILLFVERTFLESRPQLKREYVCSKTRQLSIVHPRMFELAAKRPVILLKELWEARDAALISEEEFQARIARMLSRA